MNDKKNNVNNLKKPRLKKINGYSAYIYLALAVCIVTALTIGIFTLSYDYTDITSTPQVIIPDISVPEIILPNVSDSPVGGEESNVDATIADTPIYVNPIKNGTVTKGYSVDALVFSSTMQDYRIHGGIDLAAIVGTEVLSYADGTIKEINNDPFYGTTVVIDHAYGLTSYYKSLAAELPETVVVGATVKAGDIIGAVGSTARIESTDAAHLHLEMTVGGELIDPLPELDGIN